MSKSKSVASQKAQPKFTSKLLVVKNEYATSPLIGSDPEVGKVYETYDYGKFKFFENNRKISAKNKTKLTLSIKKVGQLQNILCDPAFRIGEGQHRFEILRDNNLPVRYEVRSAYDINQIRETQQGMPWKHSDILNYYCHSTDPVVATSYKLFKEFSQRFGLGHNMTLAFVTGKYSNAVDNEAFAYGQMRINQKQYETAFNEAQRLEQFKPFHKRYKSRTFVLAYFSLIKRIRGYNHAHMIKQIAKYRGELDNHSKANLYVENLTNIYNKYLPQAERLVYNLADLVTNA